ncbi:MAG: glycosyltransferase family 117 protein [Anaerolineae bacterium]
MITHPLLRRQMAIALSLFVAAMILYTITLAPSIAALFDDSLEFQLVTYLLGIAHPTGYPLFTLLGWLFTRLPIGEVAFRVNLMSAFFGAVTVALVYLAGLQLAAHEQNWTANMGAALGALALAVSPVYWSQATMAEVYTLHACLIIALLWVLLRMSNMVHAPEEENSHWVHARLDRSISALACLFGLGLAHHRTIVLLLPAIFLVLWRIRHWARPRPKHLLWFGAPLLLYLYLPLRGHVGSLDGSYANTIAGFLRHVTAWGYGSFIFQNPFSIEHGADFYLDLFVQQFGWVGIALILIGVLLQVRQKRWAVGVTTLIFVGYAGFNLFYHVADLEVFFIPNFLICALWLGYGVARLLTLLQFWGGISLSPLAKPAASFASVLIVVGSLSQSGLLLHSNFAEMDRSGDWTLYDYGLDILGQPLEPGAVIVGIQGEITLVRYFQSVHGLREDVRTLAADDPSERLAVVNNLVEQGASVYLTRSLAGAPERWSLGAVGPLIRVYALPQHLAPALRYKVDAVLTPEIALWGYDIVRPPTHTAPSPVRLSLVWHVLAPISRDLKVSARLLTQDGRLMAQADAVPVHFAYPTVAWRTGEYIVDVYDLESSEPLSDELYTPLIILYDPAKGAAEVARATLLPFHLP